MIEKFIMDNILTPGLAVGVTLGGISMYFAITSGRVATPQMVKLKSEIVGLKSELASLTIEVATFRQWRDNLVTERLSAK